MAVNTSILASKQLRYIFILPLELFDERISNSDPSKLVGILYNTETITILKIVKTRHRYKWLYLCKHNSKCAIKFTLTSRQIRLSGVFEIINLISEPENDHKGQIYNKYTGRWTWL